MSAIRLYGAPQGDGGLKPGIYVAECGDCGDSSGLKKSPAARLTWANAHRCKQEADRSEGTRMNLRCPVHPILHGRMEWTSQGGTWLCYVCGWSAVHIEEWYRVAKPLKGGWKS